MKKLFTVEGYDAFYIGGTNVMELVLAIKQVKEEAETPNTL